jgi:hypothetical protein
MADTGKDLGGNQGHGTTTLLDEAATFEREAASKLALAEDWDERARDPFGPGSHAESFGTAEGEAGGIMDSVGPDELRSAAYQARIEAAAMLLSAAYRLEQMNGLEAAGETVGTRERVLALHAQAESIYAALAEL